MLTDKEKERLKEYSCIDCEDPGPQVWLRGDCPFAGECREVLIKIARRKALNPLGSSKPTHGRR